MIIELNAMRRESLRRSSLGLQRKPYSLPSLPHTEILRGFWREVMIVTTSSNSVPHRQRLCEERWRTIRTVEDDETLGEWLVGRHEGRVGGKGDVERFLEGDDEHRRCELVETREILLHAEWVVLGDLVVAEMEERVDELDPVVDESSDVDQPSPRVGRLLPYRCIS